LDIETLFERFNVLPGSPLFCHHHRREAALSVTMDKLRDPGRRAAAVATKRIEIPPEIQG
jgi:hypothetical protein